MADEDFFAGPDVQAFVARIDHPQGLPAFHAQVAASGNCAHPVRLAGKVSGPDSATGELVTTFDSRQLPDGVLLRACGNRRASRCPPCSAVYKEDARHLVTAGLEGGKGIPHSVARHPAVFVTLTGPSFGPVHSAGATPRPCRPGPAGHRCSHGVPLTCFARHRKDEVVVGEPLCAACYRSDEHVLWNALSPELWRRTTIYLQRHLARLVGTTPAVLRTQLRLAHLRVAEFQRRGVVHLYAVLRADGPDGPASPPPVWCSASLLAAALRSAASAVSVPYPLRLGRRVTPLARWGLLVDVSPLEGAAAGRRTARYIAKYLQKATDSGGVLDRRLSAIDVATLRRRELSEHETALVETAWRLGGRSELAELHLRHWAHQLGYRGHCLAKSRAYSTTLGALRAARAAYEAERRGSAPERPGRRAHWTYAGSGHISSGDALLARLWAEQAAENRWLAWMAYDDERSNADHGIFTGDFDDDLGEDAQSGACGHTFRLKADNRSGRSRTVAPAAPDDVTDDQRGCSSVTTTSSRTALPGS